MIKWLIPILVICMICIVEWLREIVTFKVTHYMIQSPKLNGLEKERKIVFLSDLHNNCYGKNNEKLLRSIKEQAPDIILIGGDMLIGKANISTKNAENFVSKLVEICPVYYANGNHEQRMKVYPQTYGNMFYAYKDKLTFQGVTFLENENISFDWDGYEIKVYGLEIPIQYYKKFRKKQMPVEVVAEKIGTTDDKTYHILLAHNPTYVDAYLEWGADMILCGHLHGGIIRIPGLGGLITPQFHLFPKYSGENTKRNGKEIVVSKGLGSHTIKARFFNPAEIVVLHYEKKK